MFADNDYFLVLFSKKITFSFKKKITLQKKLLQLRNNQMVLIQMPLETQTVFIVEECENLKVALDGGELTRNINKKKKPVALQAEKCLLCDKC